MLGLAELRRHQLIQIQEVRKFCMKVVRQRILKKNGINDFNDVKVQYFWVFGKDLALVIVIMCLLLIKTWSVLVLSCTQPGSDCCLGMMVPIWGLCGNGEVLKILCLLSISIESIKLKFEN